MHLGTHLRKQSGLAEAVALLGIEEIARIREEDFAGRESSNAFIVRSLKTPSEVQLLRNVYGKGFYLISVYSHRENRVVTLSDRLSKSLNGNADGCRARAERLVEVDEVELNNREFGQDVQDAFPLADLFVNSDDRENLRAQVKRFIELIFGFRFSTPSRDEHGMQHARSAALRSSDMNRQVGAAFTNAEGDLLVVGCNDVPKAGGGFYWPETTPDERDFKKGIDSMSEHRAQVIREFLARLDNAQLLKVDSSIAKLAESLVSGDLKWVLRGATATSVLEFGRSVHAEMAAISTAARLGISLEGSTLYVTTFPCHICARHIVASGVKNVFYIEPYPKSRARKLHGDSILVDPITPSEKLVNFQPFKGIAPSRYFELFESGDARKDGSGKVVPWKMATATPRFQRFIVTYRRLETTIVGDVLPAIRGQGITVPTAEIDALIEEFQ